MGSTSSVLLHETPGADVRLPNAGLKFTQTQLHSLNSYVEAMFGQDQMGRMSLETESAMENLVQRLVDGAGQRDPRFRCCHLIALHRERKMRSRSLEYLVPLDSIPALNSTDGCFLQEGPVGYGRVKLTGRVAHQWEEFMTPEGFLSRDKVVERWVDLLARCAHAKGGGSSRVISARAEQYLEPFNYCYLERASNARQSPNLRLAIVEGSVWVMVRMADVEAKLVLTLKVRGCSRDATSVRVPLIHPLAVVHYEGAQVGFHCAAVSPPSSLMCARSATWQLWLPAMQADCEQLSASSSSVAKISGALNALIDRLRDGVLQGSLQVLSRFSCRSTLLRRLHRNALQNKAAVRACISQHQAHYLLLIIDDLISVCEGRLPAAFFYEIDKSCCTRRGIRASEQDWKNDAECLKRFLGFLHADSSKADNIPPSVSESLEMVLFDRWEKLLKESRNTSAGIPYYSNKQLQYIWKVCSELLKCKNMIVYESYNTFRANIVQATSIHSPPIEDLVHLMAIILDQARDVYLNNFYQNTGVSNDNVFSYRSKKWSRLKAYYDASSACLIDAVRKDPELRRADLNDDLVVAKHLLDWLYRGAKEDKKYLGPVLKPYLENLYLVSLENCWFLEDYEMKKCKKEVRGLREYCRAVHDGGLEPNAGLLNAAKKLSWAKAMVELIDRYRHEDLRLVFPSGSGMAISFPTKLCYREQSVRSLTLNRRDKAEAKLKLSERTVVGAFANLIMGTSRINKRNNSTEEILRSLKSGNYWRNGSKPDLITSNLPIEKPLKRRIRPITMYGFPEISMTDKKDVKTLRRKYHTLRSLVYNDTVELKERPRSAASSLKVNESEPSLLETMDFINGIRQDLCVEESSASDTEQSSWSPLEDWYLGQTAPINVLSKMTELNNPHLLIGDVIVALLRKGKFSVLQELCSWLSDSRESALFALHRLARTARSRSSEKPSNSWKLPEERAKSEPNQVYRKRPPDYMSGDENRPKPPPRTSSKQIMLKIAETKPVQLEDQLQALEISKPANPINVDYTGVINQVKLPKDRFAPKRSKSLGRSFSTKKVNIDIGRYNLTLGKKAKYTNDVVNAVMGNVEPGCEARGTYFRRS